MHSWIVCVWGGEGGEGGARTITPMIIATATTGWRWLGLNVKDGDQGGHGPVLLRVDIGHKTVIFFGKVYHRRHVPPRFQAGSRDSVFLANQMAGMDAECITSRGITISGHIFSLQHVFDPFPLSTSSCDHQKYGYKIAGIDNRGAQPKVSCGTNVWSFPTPFRSHNESAPCGLFKLSNEIYASKFKEVAPRQAPNYRQPPLRIGSTQGSSEMDVKKKCGANLLTFNFSQFSHRV